MAQFTRNEDGSVTIRIPKGPEVYDEASGALFVEETVDAEAFDALAGFDPAPPLVLTVEDDGSISQVAGGPLEEPISTGPTADRKPGEVTVE